MCLQRSGTAWSASELCESRSILALAWRGSLLKARLPKTRPIPGGADAGYWHIDVVLMLDTGTLMVSNLTMQRWDGHYHLCGKVLPSCWKLLAGGPLAPVPERPMCAVLQSERESCLS
ncbi:hypothetical protein HPB50_008823 [Hyalomma asiaticum]|uniref:Uncharacterized protein n=1 Tax=Hyalomma asiaticum TaxID=266040 RepID=A0ACB7TDA4_HYAAI|nr:hypothetical protein HPB50_008823 [Hyalomma asiaticum]